VADTRRRNDHWDAGAAVGHGWETRRILSWRSRSSRPRPLAGRWLDRWNVWFCAGREQQLHRGNVLRVRGAPERRRATKVDAQIVAVVRRIPKAPVQADVGIGVRL